MYQEEIARTDSCSHSLIISDCNIAMSEHEKIGIISEISRTSRDFEWQINDFNSYTKLDSSYYSPEFHLLNSTWQILIKQHGNSNSSENSAGFLSLFLKYVDGRIPASLDFALGFKTAKETIVHKKEAPWKFDYVGWSQFIKRSELMNEKEDLLPSGKLTVICTLTAKDPKQGFNERLSKLAEDFSELWTSKDNSDVTLKIDEGTVLSHRAILAARSPVFKAMFRNNMTEKNTSTVNISDCESKAFNIFLHYLYSGGVEFEECNVYDLYKIAHKYDVPELKEMCIDFIIYELSVENVCQAYAFSVKFEEERLRSFTHQYFCENFQKIMFSNDWKLLMEENSELASDLLKHAAPKVKIVF